jgi:DNA-binding NarL/FixJ family response regulator
MEAGQDPAPREFLVIDDHPLFCEALSMTLARIYGSSGVVTATSLGEALERIAGGADPDAILLDLRLPDVEGLDGLIRLRGALPGAPVVVISSLDDPRLVAGALGAGAVGFIPKQAGRAEIEAAFARIWAGEIYTPPGYRPPAPEVAREGPGEDAVERLAQLTPQQARILELVCAGKLNKQIAYDLSIAEATVKAHITAILRKLGVQSRTQAVLVAQQARFGSILQEAAPPR